MTVHIACKEPVILLNKNVDQLKTVRYIVRMNVTELDALKQLLEVPAPTYHEKRMVRHIVGRVESLPGVRVWSDKHNNVYIIKGSDSKPLPCIAAHLDNVQSMHRVKVVQHGDYLRGERNGLSAGFGADDKTGVHAALRLLERFENIALVFFAMEETGHLGASKADADFFAKIGYMIEFDAPSRHLVSYTSGGVRLFDNKGEFIQRAWPVLQAHGSVLWQHHPYSDVRGVRGRFPISCLNLSCGYYNWHMQDEYIKISEVEMAVEQGEALVKALDSVRYTCPKHLPDDQPLCKIGRLSVPSP